MRGYSFLEVLVAALVSGALIGTILLALNSGQLTDALSSAQSELQAEARRSIDWIAQDARQAVGWDMANAGNDPSVSHIKFRKVEGWDIANNTFRLSANFTEYGFDANTTTLTRRLSNAANATLQTWIFNNITQAPFYTLDTSNNTVALNSADLLTSTKLLLRIATEKPVRGMFNATVNMTEEVKIRNE
jgi:type II secretory pathway pseudopilin PulG